MTQPSYQTIWNYDEKDLLKFLESREANRLQKNIRFYAPEFTYYKSSSNNSLPNSFPTISITGASCALNCKHCGAKVLETMEPAILPNDLFNLGLKLKQEGVQSCLISGGCLPDGSVPLFKFAPVLGRLKHELGLTIYVHTGIINLETAIALKNAGVDAALIDVIGSAETMENVCNLKVPTKNYADSLKALDQSGLNFVPHVIVGLNEGKLSGELTALKIINKVKPSAIVIIAFMPIHGTPMAKVKPPKPADIAKVTVLARLMFSKTPIALGCMRPKGELRNQTDVLALKAGVDAIAFPSEEAIKYAKMQSYKIFFSSLCCAQISMDVAHIKK
jgi:lipoyl synthase